MIRTLFTSTALVALISAGAFAAPEMNSENKRPVFNMETNQKIGASQNGYFANEKGQLLATSLIGTSIYNGTSQSAERIGEVNDLLLAEDGTVKGVILGVGGFIGINEKEVAVDFSRLYWAMKNDEQILFMDTTVAEIENAPVYDKQITFADARTFFDKVTGQSNENVMLQTVANVSAEKLIGTNIQGENGESVGEVGDVILASDDKTIDAVIIDVGGFLGLGSKPVAVKMDQLQLMQDQDANIVIKSSLSSEDLKNAAEYKK